MRCLLLLLTSTAESGHCNRDYKACKAQNVYSLVLYGKNLLTWGEMVHPLTSLLHQPHCTELLRINMRFGLSKLEGSIRSNVFLLP